MPRAEKTPPVTPYLTVRGGKAAIEFYKKAFGAKVGMLMMADDKQRVMHATLLLNGAAVMLSDVFDEYQQDGFARPPQEAGGASVMVHLEVPVVDQSWNKAVKAGAKVLMPLADQFWGARYGQITDPFGHVWSMASPIKAKAPAKAAARKKGAARKAAKKKR